ncbi:nuclear transport factor 2 family protein [Aquabacterium sp. A7-Y]|uniref:nuclear transport factor 2 family protein n=1 Tax=Aquabacterium sp. A7-Y TaxID=1349605 RepID=UPI00223DBF13|nr:nuclear transport factor 2 family protein [Aquabacterium sp. A7-Y]MCW7539679.1 nuclear transport factor 2 family protein [Aquabacterium sp. A7-Y]
MSHDNKQLMQGIFDEMAKGNGRPFVDAMAEDFCWSIPGQSTWSRRWEGKQAVVNDLFRPLFARFADTYVSRAHRFIAEGDHVVVQCRGEVTTKTGKRYDNDYCLVCRIVDGKLRELTEYMDTELATTALGAP